MRVADTSQLWYTVLSMPTHLMLRCSWQFENTDPKNQAVITPCFRRQLDITDPTSGTDAKQLCDDLLAAISSWSVVTSDALTVTAYNLQGAKPNYPMAQSKGSAVPNTLTSNPQQALCLSFYGTDNVPRKRGRLYLPAWLMTTSFSETGAPIASATIRTKAAALVPIFAGLGGANVDWIVWSRAGSFASKVTNYFVDEAWDVQRRRKLKSANRTTGTTSG
jgi:hypothetical protein